jgi:hypothetical protein
MHVNGCFDNTGVVRVPAHEAGHFKLLTGAFTNDNFLRKPTPSALGAGASVPTGDFDITFKKVAAVGAQKWTKKIGQRLKCILCLKFTLL